MSAAIAPTSLGTERETHELAARCGVAVRCTDRTRVRRTAGRVATSIRVQRHLVGSHAVDALHDVDFAARRPVLALRPKARPDLRTRVSGSAGRWRTVAGDIQSSRTACGLHQR